MKETTTNIYVSRKFNSSVNDLFRWVTRPELIGQWFGPKQMKVISVDNDLSVGGHYKIDLSKQDGGVLSIEGTYAEIEEPHHLVFTFRYTGIQNPPPESVVKITLEAIGSNVSVLSLMQKFETIPSDMENRTKAWEFMLSRLSERME